MSDPSRVKDKNSLKKPLRKPQNPCFGSGPCAKLPGWNLMALKEAVLGRSHRSLSGIKKIQVTLGYIREVLEIPSSHHIALLSGSATAAVECLLWNLLGARPVGIVMGEFFSQRWASDIINELGLPQTHLYKDNTDLANIDFSQDVVFVWNGSTSGQCVPQESWIDPHRQGLTLCDATSAAFAMPLPWTELDATAFSWQKGLGGEAGIGLVVLGPRAIERLETYTPTWPIPYLYKLIHDRKLKKEIFEGLTLNTPSFLVLEDALYALKWAKQLGGIQGMYNRTLLNFSKIQAWVERTPWIDFLISVPSLRSPTTVCLKFVENPDWAWVQNFCQLLEKEGVGFDIKNHAAAPPSIRIWAGPTMEADNLEALFPWLDWCYATLKQ